MSEKRAELLLACVIIARSTSFVFNKLGLGTMTAFNLLAVRFLLAFALLALVFCRKLRHVGRRTLLRGALLGGLFFLIMSGEMFSLRTVDSGTVSLLENMAILFVPLLESAISRRLPRPATLLSAAVALVGVALLTSAGGAFRIGVGACIALCTALVYACAIITTDRLSHRDDALVLGILQVGFLGFYALFDFLRSSRGAKAASQDAHGGGSGGLTGVSVKLQSLSVPPMITFDEDLVPGGRRISGWIVACGGVVVGLLAAIMGVGGGFVTFPMFVYIFGVSSMTTVGTDILQIIFTAGFAAVGQYAIYGYVFYTLAIGMLLGSLLGIQIGALTTKVVKGIHIRGFYAISIIAGFINRATTLPKKLVEMEVLHWSPSVVNIIEDVGNVVFWVVVAFFGLWVFSKFFLNLGKLRGEA